MSDKRKRDDTEAPAATLKGTTEASAFSIPADPLVRAPLVIDPAAQVARVFTEAEVAACLEAAIKEAWALRPPPRREAVDGHSWGRGRQDAVLAASRAFTKALSEVRR